MSDEAGPSLREKWKIADALAGEASPAAEARSAAASGSYRQQRMKAGSYGRSYLGWLVFLTGSALGLGLGIVFALLLVDGEISLSLKEIRTIAATLSALFSG